MRGLVLLLTLVLVSNVMAEREITDDKIMALLKAHQNTANKIMKVMSEMEEEEAKVLGEEMADIEERDVDSPLGL